MRVNPPLAQSTPQISGNQLRVSPSPRPPPPLPPRQNPPPGGPPQPPSTAASECDLTSIRSDDSSDSENFVIIGQATDPDPSDSALFNIHSKRASPVHGVVEEAAEVTEDLLVGDSGGSEQQLRPQPRSMSVTPLPMAVSNPALATMTEGMVRERKARRVDEREREREVVETV